MRNRLIEAHKNWFYGLASQISLQSSIDCNVLPSTLLSNVEKDLPTKFDNICKRNTYNPRFAFQ